MFTIKSTKTAVITPEEARHLLTKNNFSSQRNISKSHVVALRRAIDSGDFHVGSVCIASNGDGKEYLMNGQHQLTAAILASKPITVSLVKAHCPTRSDMSRLFAQFDVGRSRNLTDIVSAEMDAANIKWFWRTGNLVAAAMNILFEKPGQSRHEKAENVVKHVKIGNFVNQFINEQTKHLWKAPIVAAMIRTYWKNKEDAERFWYGVATGEMMKASDARLTLREYLISIKNDRGGGQSRKEIIAKCIAAWNAFRSGKRTALKYYADKPIPSLV